MVFLTSTYTWQTVSFYLQVLDCQLLPAGTWLGRLSILVYRHLTPISSTPWYNPLCHGGSNAYTPMVTNFKSGVYHLLHMYCAHIDAGIKLSASQSLLRFFSKQFCKLQIPHLVVTEILHCFIQSLQMNSIILREGRSYYEVNIMFRH